MVWPLIKTRAGVWVHRIKSCVLIGQVDFDGDQEYCVFVFDNESKAKAYGGWGHHQVLDKNTPFKVGNYSGQTSTNLMNLNTLMAQEPLVG